MKRFNTAGKCIPEEHYMVDISDRVAAARKMVERGTYFTINRGRQYGKTTLISELKKDLSRDHCVFSISFEGMGDTEFESVSTLLTSVFKLLKRDVRYKKVSNLSESSIKYIESRAEKEDKITGVDMYDIFSELNALNDTPVVMIIDEVDQAGNYDTFLKFLGVLRDMYLNRTDTPTFRSVILAGVYDIKNLKLKIRDENEHQYNSPWNIADSYDVDMSFNTADIKGMLEDYEKDHKTGMNMLKIADEIHSYTSGYPFLVSRICRIIDESDGNIAWNRTGVEKAVKILQEESNTLFDDMIKKIDDFPELKEMLRDILYNGKTIAFNIDDRAINIASRFNFIKNEENAIVVSNRIFETRLYNLFASEEALNNSMIHEGSIDRNQFVKDGHLDMKRILERFIVHYNAI